MKNLLLNTARLKDSCKDLFVKLSLLGLLINFTDQASAQCSAAGPNIATVFVNDLSVGTVAWTNPSNAQNSDNIRATAGIAINALSSVSTNYLVSSGYGFSIPSTATVCGIEVAVERRQQGVLIGSSVKDNSVKLIKSGLILGTEHASGTSWTSSDGIVTYGGASDLWGSTWTPADINSANFGAAYVSAALNSGLAALFLSAEIDQIQVTVYYQPVILPIELKSFEALRQEDAVNLKWTTATETGNAFFTIERSTDAISWQHVKNIPGEGNSAAIVNYSYTDYYPSALVSYYRLKQTDYNGQYKYSGIVAAEGTKTKGSVTVMPNPSEGIVQVRTPFGNWHLEVRNSTGELIYNANVVDTDQSEINLGHAKKGVYCMIVQNGGEIFTKKFVLK